MTQTQQALGSQAQSSSAPASPHTVQLTPVTDTAPAVVVANNERSGAQWVERFPTSAATSDLADGFREDLESFVAALRSAGATVTISATLRPPERAYLMHWSWKISKQDQDPRTVPARAGVNIDWVHNDAAGVYSASVSKAAATAMVNAYGMQSLGVAPSLTSRHIEGNAIDMSISWTGTLSIINASKKTVAIATTPRTGMNTKLHEVGATYSVTKYNGSGSDAPHWSTDGR
ncbi:hypothetical protein [Uliginosibacterium sp. 31-12]|uniref:hypothetical protein n=1 Tax=Uliginosibacterium sp. 31-12 TaxID=3062781 RepID=UPI0026E3B2EF|nr:hypothetical protein [Uliginosibacterium sp. 31-12]MDO6388420.1 hypothetical protein [Uliginosibacterium sp. 31-12]